MSIGYRGYMAGNDHPDIKHPRRGERAESATRPYEKLKLAAECRIDDQKAKITKALAEIKMWEEYGDAENLINYQKGVISAAELKIEALECEIDELDQKIKALWPNI